MNKQQRAALTAQIVGVLREHGAVVEIEEDRPYRETVIRGEFPGIVRVTVDVHGRDTFAMANWHQAQGWLNPAVFSGVNPHHGAKATTVAERTASVSAYDTLIMELGAIAACIAAGKAFVERPAATS